MMDTTRQIQIAVARADLIVCTVLRWLAVIVPLTIVFLLVLLVVWKHRPDPYLIDYDAPGVDITSEGPEAYTDEWYRWEAMKHE
jgi:hypothetical protein